MTYREMRRKLEILGCRFQRQADSSGKQMDPTSCG